MLGQRNIKYCMMGVIISADMSFFGIVKPMIVKIILNSSSKCFSLSEIDICPNIILNFLIDSSTKNYQSIGNYDKSFLKNPSMLIIAFASFSWWSYSNVPSLRHLYHFYLYFSKMWSWILLIITFPNFSLLKFCRICLLFMKSCMYETMISQILTKESLNSSTLLPFTKAAFVIVLDVIVLRRSLMLVNDLNECLRR